jgi:hypothetical protein
MRDVLHVVIRYSLQYENGGVNFLAHGPMRRLSIDFFSKLPITEDVVTHASLLDNMTDATITPLAIAPPLGR